MASEVHDLGQEKIPCMMSTAGEAAHLIKNLKTGDKARDLRHITFKGALVLIYVLLLGQVYS